MPSDSEPTDSVTNEASDFFVKGLATPTYLAMRGKEECYRVRRYGRPLSLVMVRLGNPDAATERKLQNWLRSDVRASDVPAYLGDATYAVLLPESDAKGAGYMMNRMCVAIPRLRAVNVECPADGISWDELFANARQKLGALPAPRTALGG